jgi:hypothetical protein
VRVSDSTAVRNTIRHRAIYDGRDLLGTLEQIDSGKFIARNRQRRAIGTYDSAAEAIAAIAAEAAPLGKEGGPS